VKILKQEPIQEGVNITSLRQVQWALIKSEKSQCKFSLSMKKKPALAFPGTLASIGSKSESDKTHTEFSWKFSCFLILLHG